MADESVDPQLVAHINAVLEIIHEQQAGLCAILAYLRAQPSYDVAFGVSP